MARHLRLWDNARFKRNPLSAILQDNTSRVTLVRDRSSIQVLGFDNVDIAANVPVSHALFAALEASTTCHTDF